MELHWFSIILCAGTDARLLGLTRGGLFGLVMLFVFVIIEKVKGLRGVRTFNGCKSSFGSTWIPISTLSL